MLEDKACNNSVNIIAFYLPLDRSLGVENLHNVLLILQIISNYIMNVMLFCCVGILMPG